MDQDEPQFPPMQIRLRSCADAPARVQDIESHGGLTKFRAKLDEDSADTGCRRYLVFHEGDGRILAWRDDAEFREE